MQEKRIARLVVKAKLDALSEAEKEMKSRRAAECVCGMPEFVGAKRVLLYAALPDECDPRCVAELCLKEGKELYLPCVSDDGMRAVRVLPNSDFNTDKFGIQVPIGEFLDEVSTLDFILVPLRAASEKGVRLGRGGGYYDRFLPLAEHAFLCGFGFAAQLLDEVPSEAFDVALDAFVCEDGRRDFAKVEK